MRRRQREPIKYRITDTFVGFECGPLGKPVFVWFSLSVCVFLALSLHKNVAHDFQYIQMWIRNSYAYRWTFVQLTSLTDVQLCLDRMCFLFLYRSLARSSLRPDAYARLRVCVLFRCFGRRQIFGQIAFQNHFCNLLALVVVLLHSNWAVAEFGDSHFFVCFFVRKCDLFEFVNWLMGFCRALLPRLVALLTPFRHVRIYRSGPFLHIQLHVDTKWKYLHICKWAAENKFTHSLRRYVAQ